MCTFQRRSLCIAAVLWFLFVAAETVEAALPPIIGVIKGDSTHVLFGQAIIPIRNQGTNHTDLLIDNGRGANYLYRGGLTPDTIPNLKFDTTNTSYNQGCDIGDVNLDGYDDFVLKWGYFGWQRLNLYYGGPGIHTSRDLWFGLDSLKALGPAKVCRNLRNDGRTYLVTGGEGSSSIVDVLLFDMTPPVDSVPELYLKSFGVAPIDGGSLGQDIAFGDYNGDGITDIAANLVMRGSSTRLGEVWIYFGGASFDTIPSLILRRPGPFQTDFNIWGTSIECPGDLNGDGYDDLIVGGAGLDTTVFIYFGGAPMDTIPDLNLTPSGEIISAASDINGDGYPDFFVTTPSPYSGGGRVRLYSGGPSMDGVPDLTIYDYDIPGYHTGFGTACTGIGDFDGDGSNDFAFALYDNDHRGNVYIFSGQRPTATPFGPNRNLPSSLILKPPYPNPFNPSTTISFDLPTRGQVTLTVFDITGRVVKTLLKTTLSAGPHSVAWDGLTSSGQPAASGVYLFTLKTPTYQKTVKGTLLK